MPDPAEISLSGRRIAVTGGGGFVGSHLVDGLVEQGAVVRLLGPLGRTRPQVTALLEAGRVEQAEAGEGCQALVHLAYRAPGALTAAAALHTEVAQNHLETVRMLEDAERWGIEHVVFASSVSVYRPAEERIPETAPAGEGVAPYGAVKAMQEMRCRSWAEATGGLATILRLSNVYGPGETLRRAIPRFLQAAQERRPPVVAGTGRGRFDPIFVDDVVDAFISALRRRRCRTYNVASGVPRTTREVAELVLRMAGLDIEPIYETERDDGDRPLPDVERAANDLGFRARTPLETGLLVERGWLRQNPPGAGLGTSTRSARDV
ncbi:MAG TPA: NAD(P)-dependent oxidoreductase [Candidatus Dormibacteraeota bacterium]|jgi:nucleoside-diphosphate-sugar epimerase|nr:NAD(P)-dependent oxidoreductase [Candidatus Dormibacteraeota bacterium]